MTDRSDRELPQFCLVTLTSEVVDLEEVESAARAALRATDAVLVGPQGVLAAIAGGEAAARAAVTRIRSLVPAPDLVVDLVPPDSEDFEDLMIRVLPLDHLPHPRVRVPSAADPGVQATALVVEDATDVRLMLRQLLSAHGWRALVVESAREAMSRAREEPDLVIIEHHLRGDLSGTDVAALYRLAGLEMPIFLFVRAGWPTAAADAARTRSQLIAKGSPDELIAALERVEEDLLRAHRRRLETEPDS